MSKKTKFSEKELRNIAEQKINYRRSVRIHWAVYVLVNVLLSIINLLGLVLDGSLSIPATDLQVAISQIWVFYPLFGWLVGLMMHTVAYIMYANGVYPMAKRGVIFHFTAYIMVNLLLFMVNFMTYPIFYWVIFPLLFWGAGFIAHFIVYNIYYKGGISEEGQPKSKKEKAIEKEMTKMRKKMED